jgi:predicted enzyme related to lactoylglutathione lyase
MTVTTVFPILLTRDLPRLRDFYARACETEVGYEFAADGSAEYIALPLGSSEIGIARDPGLPEETGAQRFALWIYVDDCDAAFARFLAAGAREVSPPTDMPWGERVASVLDPDGNTVNLGRAAASDS